MPVFVLTILFQKTQRLPLKNFLKTSIGSVLNEQQQKLKLDSAN